MIVIESIQCGRVVTEGDPLTEDPTRREWTTAFYKNPINGPVEMAPMGLVGDSVANTKNHGGRDKAVLCYAASHYEKWAAEFPELGMSAGGMAENLTIAGIDETTVCIGDRYTIGNCVIEVSQPRQPCWKINRRWGNNTVLKRVTQTGRTGWYVRVIQGGTISAGDEVSLTAQPHPNWTVARAGEIMVDKTPGTDSIEALKNLPELSPEWKKDLP
ncbi:MOSC domain-containing protein [Rubripirellula reticaptiva]|uniref:6-N-hydroxylaminopurine resistance protein n=1 Tax=Rubripirellula reticaptiva TaxID=2528013 RepID=A0A5C6F875_9BACT|nr:MOSC domain-containing protein [Rubripirellula reticaptiva]TWU57943.1 6-N-hydroxylaminopurine resistance protein [Rubripirellula reticaptiva]